MPEWKKLVCPVDFSAAARAALEQAAGIARREAAELFVLHVRHGGSGATDAIGAPPPHGAAPAADDPEALLEAWTRDAQQLAPGSVTSVELAGDAATEIARFADEFACDLIVMGTHGRSRIAHLALGSVAEKVIRATRRPVLVVHEDAPRP